MPRRAIRGGNALLKDSETSVKRAALINVTSRYAAILIQLAYSIMLARILTPDEFGIVAIAQVFVAFFNLFADMGLGSAIIQRQDLEKLDIARLFACTIVLGLVLSVLFASLGVPMSFLYGRNELRIVFLFLAFSVLFGTLNTIPNALLLKNKRFVSVGVRQIVSTLMASAVGLASALAGASYVAIAIYSIVYNAFIFLWNYRSNFVKPVFKGSIAAVRKVFDYSAYLFGFSFINYFARNSDNLLIGYYFGAASLGNYSKAYQLMYYPLTYLTNIVTPVLHPMLAERQANRDYIYSFYIKTVKLLSLLGVYVTLLFCFCSEEIIGALYGDQWLMAAPYLSLLSVSIWSQMICGTSGTMFQLLNRTKDHFVRGLIISLTVTASIFVGVALGSIEAVSLCVGVSSYVAFVTIGPFLIKRAFGRSIVQFYRELLPDLGIALCLVLVHLFLNGMIVGNVYLVLGIKIVISGIAYIALLILFHQFKWFQCVLPQALLRRIPKSIIE